MYPKQGLGFFKKKITSSERTTKLHSTRPRENGDSQLRQKEQRKEFVVDSGASLHMVSEKDLNSAELETMRTSRSPTTVMTAIGEVQTHKEATVYVKQLDLFVTVLHISSEMARECDCNKSNCAPFVVSGLSVCSSSTTTTPSSPSQDSVFDVNRYTENPVPERSGSTSGELWGDLLHESTETENTNKNEESKEVQRDIIA